MEGTGKGASFAADYPFSPQMMKRLRFSEDRGPGTPSNCPASVVDAGRTLRVHSASDAPAVPAGRSGGHSSTAPDCTPVPEAHTAKCAGHGRPWAHLTQHGQPPSLTWCGFLLLGPRSSFSRTRPPPLRSPVPLTSLPCVSCCPYSSGPVQTQGASDVAPTALTSPNTCRLCPPLSHVTEESPTCLWGVFFRNQALLLLGLYLNMDRIGGLGNSTVSMLNLLCFIIVL